MQKYRRSHLASKMRKLRPKKKFFQRPWFWLAVIAVIAGSACYLFFWYPALQVSHISISGNREISSRDIEQVARQAAGKKILSLGAVNITTKNIFLVDTGTVSRSILKVFPTIGEAVVTRKFPGSLAVAIRERQPLAVFCNDGSLANCFFIDDNGVIFKQVTGPWGEMPVVTKDGQSTQVVTGDDVVSQNTMEAIGKISDDLRNRFQIDVREAFVSNPLVITTAENWKVYFDPGSDIDSQISRLNVLLGGEISPASRPHIQYIYLQYRDRAYYK